MREVVPVPTLQSVSRLDNLQSESRLPSVTVTSLSLAFQSSLASDGLTTGLLRHFFILMSPVRIRNKNLLALTDNANWGKVWLGIINWVKHFQTSQNLLQLFRKKSIGG